jgi:hypothetical protein
VNEDVARNVRIAASKLVAQEEALQARILALLEKHGTDQYNLSAHPLVASVQHTRPRCPVGCPCSASRQWRDMAERIIEFVEGL